MSRRPIVPRRRSRKHAVPPVAWAFLAAAFVLAIHGHVAELALNGLQHIALLALYGVGVAAAVYLAIPVVYVLGIALRLARPPARITLGRMAIEFL